MDQQSRPERYRGRHRATGLSTAQRLAEVVAMNQAWQQLLIRWAKRDPEPVTEAAT